MTAVTAILLAPYFPTIFQGIFGDYSFIHDTNSALIMVIPASFEGNFHWVWLDSVKNQQEEGFCIKTERKGNQILFKELMFSGKQGNIPGLTMDASDCKGGGFVHTHWQWLASCMRGPGDYSEELDFVGIICGKDIKARIAFYDRFSGKPYEIEWVGG